MAEKRTVIIGKAGTDRLKVVSGYLSAKGSKMEGHERSKCQPTMNRARQQEAPVKSSHLPLEDMAQVASTLGAGDLHTLHAVGIVLMPVHSSCSSQA